MHYYCANLLTISGSDANDCASTIKGETYPIDFNKVLSMSTRQEPEYAEIREHVQGRAVIYFLAEQGSTFAFVQNLSLRWPDLLLHLEYYCYDECFEGTITVQQGQGRWMEYKQIDTGPDTGRTRFARGKLLVDREIAPVGRSTLKLRVHRTNGD